MITLATLHTATAQEVFDQIVHHLLRQGRASKNEHGSCYYRHTLDDGTVLKCAAGALIADNEYNPDMDFNEETSWYFLVEEGIIPTNNHSILINDLQRVHDDVDVEKWSESFEKIALEYGLSYTFPMPKTYKQLQLCF